MLVVVAPGQGSQAAGMLRPWLAHPRAGPLLRRYGDLLGLDLVRLGTTGAPTELRDTALAQPLLVATGLLGRHLLLDGSDLAPHLGDVLAGHSVGELTVAALSGVLTDRDALRVAATRGEAMAAAAAATPSGMTAVIGAPVDVVRPLAVRHGLSVATVNGRTQTVVAGPPAALARLTAEALPGVRLVPLEVAGAFHTRAMAPAADRVRATLASMRVADPAVPVVRGLDGAVVGSGHDLVGSLGAQVASPVRWDLCQRALRRVGASGLLELPPAGTLTALARRELPGVERLPLRGPDDLAAARTFVRRHAARGA